MPKLCAKKVQEFVAADGKEIPGKAGEMRIFGIASRHELITTDKGDSSKFRGDFLATVGNQRYRAATCFLPRSAAEMLEVAIERAIHDGTNHETGELGAAAVQFGFRIFQKADPSSNVGYTWGVESLIDFASAETDPLLQLAASAS